MRGQFLHELDWPVTRDSGLGFAKVAGSAGAGWSHVPHLRSLTRGVRG